MFWAKTFKVYPDVKVLGFLTAKNMYSYYRFLYIEAILIQSMVILVKREDIKNQQSRSLSVSRNSLTDVTC